MKKFLSVLLTFTLLVSVIPAAFASDSDLFTVTYDKNHTDLYAYAIGSNGNTGNGMTNGMNAGASAFFGTDVPDGLYKITANVAANDNRAIMQAFVQSSPGTFTNPVTQDWKPVPYINWTTFSDLELGIAHITSVNRYVGVALRGSIARLKSITLTEVSSNVSFTVTIGEEEYEEGASYSQATDTIVITYEEAVIYDADASVTLSCTSDDCIIPTQVIRDSNEPETIKIALKEALDYDEEYTLNFEGIKNSLGVVMDSETISFATNGENESNPGSGSVTIDNLSINNDVVNITATIRGSHGLGIGGRTADVYIALPGSESILIAEDVVSEENGKIEINYELTSDEIRGEVLVTISSEYADDVQDECYYLSNKYIVPILEELNSQTEWEGIQAVLSENKEALNINPDEDLIGMDAQAFYEQFLSENIEATSAGEFRNLYNAFLAVEKINQTDDVSVVEDALTKDALNGLGIEVGKLDALGDYKYDLYAELVDADRIVGRKMFAMIFDKIFNTAIIAKEGIEDIVLNVSGISGVTEENTDIIVSANKLIKNLKEINLTFSFRGMIKGKIRNADFSSDIGETDVEAYGNEVAARVISASINTKDFGTFTFTTSNMGVGTVEVSGTAIVETNSGYDAVINVIKGVYEVVIADNVSVTPVTYDKTHSDLKVYANANGGGNSGNGMEQGMSQGSSAFFGIDIPEGRYLVSVRMATDINQPDVAIRAYLQSQSGEFTNPITTSDVVLPKTGWANFAEFEAGYADITADSKYIGIGISKSMARLSSITLTSVNSNVLYRLIIDSELYESGAAYSQATDSLHISYESAVICDEDANVNVIEQGSGRIIPTELLTDNINDGLVIVAIKEALDYNTQYMLTVDGVKNQFGAVMKSQSYIFMTNGRDDSNPGNGGATIESFDIDNGIVTVKGTVRSSAGVGISGRNAKLYLTLPGGVKTLVADNIISVKDGKFIVTYTLPQDDVKGKVVATLSAQYSEDVDGECYYLSKQYATPIFESLIGQTTSSAIENTLVQSKDLLGINPLEDLSGLETEEFYKQLVSDMSVELSANDFRKLYNSLVIVEKINQATNTTEIEDVLTEDAYNLLGIDSDKVDALDDYKAEFFNSLLESNRIAGSEKFVETFNELVNDTFMDKAQLSDISIATAPLSNIKGAKTDVSISSSADFSNVKEINLTINFGGILVGCVENLVITSKLGEITVEADGNTVNARIIVDDISKMNKNIAELSFVGTKSGLGTVSLSGIALGETGTAYDAKLDVDGIYAVTISEQVTKPLGGSPTASGGSSSGGSVGGGAVIAPQDTTGVANTQVFTDIDTVSWANEAIMGLYNKYVIARPADGLYNPMRNITRAEFIKMVVIAHNLGRDKNVRGSMPELPFADVNEGDWYYQYVQAANYNKVITGDTTGNFRPNDIISREDICTILSRLLKETNEQPAELFADDAQISTYARGAIYAMKDKGIVNGIGDNMFSPKAPATRAEAAKIIYGTIK